MFKQKMKRLKKEREFWERFIIGTILAILVAIYNLLWLNRSFTMSEVWAKFYNGLLDKGKIPYKDFYYYLPPLNLFEDYLIWKLSFGYFFIYKLWRLAERILIVEIMYKLLLKKAKPYVAGITCFLASVLICASVCDLIGDYNQTSQLFVALLCCFMWKYAETIDSIQKKRKWLFLSGICGGLMLLEKQPVVFANAIVFTILIGIFVYLKLEKTFFASIMYVISGASIPIICVGIYLVSNHAIEPFIYQVFIDVSSKGGIYNITVGKIVLMFQNMPYAIITVFSSFLIYLLAARHNYFIEKTNNKKHAYQILFIILSVFSFSYSYAWIFIDAWKAIWATGLIILLALQLIAGFYINADCTMGKVGYLFVLSGTFAILIINPENSTVRFYNSTSLFGFMPVVLTMLWLFLIFWAVAHVTFCRVHKQICDSKSLVVAASGIASGYTTMMANGDIGISSLAAFLVVPAFVYIILCENIINSKYIIKTLQVVTVTVLGICLSQRLTTPYSWWGDTEASYWEKTETINVKMLRGFKFSEREKKKIGGLCELIDYYTDENSIIYGFPYTKIYNALLDNYNMSGFVPVVFYDVCADDYAIYEAEMLSYREPDIVVWQDIPGCIEAHEGMYRNDGQRLGQREIQKWFSNVKDSDYTLVGQVDNVFVYKLNDGTKISRSYIEQKTAINYTAIYQDSFSQVEDESVCTLEGEGTIDSPYLITSTKDFEEFRDLVNSGMTFLGKYVRQTANIDMSGCENWEPIGIYESEHYFSGIYDGDGYIIENLYINRPDENVGLFGKLAGTVVNVSVVNCNITGNCIGGIASHGVGPSSRIINCKVTGKLFSYGRAGGIVDNLGGSIINCVTDVNLGGTLASGVSGYYTNTVMNCYSVQGDEVSVDNGKKYTRNSVDSLNSYLIKLGEEDYGSLLNEWLMKDEKIILTHKN